MKTWFLKPEEEEAAWHAWFVWPPRAPLPSTGDDSSLETPSDGGDCSRQQKKCASRNCTFLVHTHPGFGDFCCKMCEKNSGGRHGKKCERRAYPEAAPSSPRPSQTSKLPRRMPWSEEVAFRSGAVAVRDWRDASEPDSLAVCRGDRFRKAEPWDDDDAWVYAWRHDDGGGGDRTQSGWVPYMALSPASFAPPLPRPIAG